MAGALNRMMDSLGFQSAGRSFEDDEELDVMSDDDFEATLHDSSFLDDTDTVTPLRRPAAVKETPAETQRIVTVRPRSYSDAKAVADPYREGIPVIMNLTDMPEDQAQRMIDFVAGLTYYTGDRNLERITARVFLLSPTNFEVESSKSNGRDSLFN